MSTGALYHELTQAGREASWKIYYDFNNYDGDYIINSSPEATGASAGFSGYIGGDATAFKTTAPGSGYFDDNYIEIVSGEELFGEDKTFTLLISQQKIDNSCGTLFSNYKGDVIPTSGWEFGINNANKVYFKNFEMWSPNITTFNYTPYAKNFYFLAGGGSNITYGRYIPETETWERGGTLLNSSYFINNTGWFIGSGEYNYKGYIDQLFYFDEVLDFNIASKIFKASTQTLVENSGVVSGYVSGLSGFIEVATGTTGVIYNTGIVSGYVTGSGSSAYVTGDVNMGSVVSGDIYYPFVTGLTGIEGSNFEAVTDIYREVISTGALSDVVTGFNTGFSGFDYTGEVTTVYTTSGVTGVTSTGSLYEAVYSEPSGIIISGGRTYLTGTVPNDYKANTVSYLGERCMSECGCVTGDFVEYIHTTDRDNINLPTVYGYSTDFQGNTFFLSEKSSNSGISVFSNGVAQLTGAHYTYQVDSTEALPNPFRVVQSTQDGNYFLSGARTLSTGILQELGDVVIFDRAQTGSRGRLDITDTSQYAGAPFSEIDPSAQVFFNGQKIYSGIDYSAVGGFNPLSPLTDMTGTYFSAPQFDDSSFSTGENNYDLVTGSPFSGNSIVCYVNGIRQPDDMFVTYSTGVSLLETGKNIMEVGLPIIYNIKASDWRFNV